MIKMVQKEDILTLHRRGVSLRAIAKELHVNRAATVTKYVREEQQAQEAEVRAYVASGSFLGLSKFGTWLFRIAYNCYIDHCRRPRHSQAPVEAVADLPAGDTSDQSFRYQQLYQALQLLPEKEKAAISLFYFEDRSIKEISTILGMPQGTVKYNLHMGRTHLKEHIQL